MRSRTALTTIMGGFTAGFIAACNRAAPPVQTTEQTATRSAERTVFTDSALHSELCSPVKTGEDWRRVCTPLDQGVHLARPKPPERP